MKLFVALGLMMIGLSASMHVKAQEIYAVKDGSKMVLYYDDQKSSRENVFTKWSPTTGTAGITSGLAAFASVELDESMKAARPTVLTAWFYNLSQVKEFVHLEYLNTEEVTNMFDLFGYCSSLTSLDLSHFNTSKVTNMVEMFKGCTALTSLDVHNFNTEKVENMESMFNECASLTLLNLSSFNTSNVTNMDFMFYDCSLLKVLNICNFSNEKLTTAEAMFQTCYNLITIYCNIDLGASSILEPADYMFNVCTRLVGGNGTVFDSDHKSKEYARPDDPENGKPGYFTYYEPKTEVYAVADGTKMVLYYDDQKAMRENVITKWSPTTGTVKITSGLEAFTSVELGESMKAARPTTLIAWFYNLSQVKEFVHLEYLNTEEVTNMFDLFGYCSSLTSLDLSHFNTSKVTNMVEMFQGCTALTSLDVHNFNTEKVENMESMFNECASLTSLNLSHFNTSNVENMKSMFNDCNALTELDIRNFSNEKLTIANAMFQSCYNLITIYCHVDLGASSILEPADYMFNICTRLVGGNGTVFNSDHKSQEYARPDDPENGKPGYFTIYEPKTEVYAVADGTKMVLYYDNQKDSRENVIAGWTAENGTDEMTSEERAAIISVELDASMKDARPTSLNSWFCSFGNVTEIVHLDYLNTSEVTDMSNLFNSCGVRTLDLSTFNTDKVTTMRSMFNQCNVSNLNISSFNTSNVTNMRYMFASCWSLTELDITHFNTEKVEDMGYMFIQTRIKVLDLRNFSVAKNPNMDNMFWNTSSLTTIICDQDWSQTTGADYWMFESCKSLVGGQGTKWSASNPSDKTYARPDGLDGKPGYFTSEDAAEEATDWPCGVGEYAYSVDVIEPGTFAILMVDAMGAQTWTEVKSLCVSGNLNADDQAWLAKMPNIQYLNLRHTNITEFGECKEYKSLEKVVLPKTCKTLKKQAFYRCEKLTSINLKYVENIGEEAFMYCELLPSESVDLRNAKWVNHRAFAYCKALTIVSLPKATYVGTQCFTGCVELTAAYLPSVLDMGGSVFSQDNKLAYIELCDELRKLEGGEFYDLKALKSIKLPRELRYIGSQSLNKIERIDGDWPKYLNHVGTGNFMNLTSVVIGPYITYWYSLSDKWTDIYCYAIDPATVLSGYINSFNDAKVANMTLHVPTASVASYKLNAGYSKFGKILAMDDIIYDLNVNSDFKLLKTDNISEHANLELLDGGALTTSAPNDLKLSSYHQLVSCNNRKGYSTTGSGDDKLYYEYLYHTSVLYANSPVSAQNVTVSLVPRHKAWSFFSLPFDVNMQDITISTIGRGKYANGEGVEGVSQWVIREYSCENRASGEGATWNNVPEDGVLKANTGYILYWLVEGGTVHTNDYYNGRLTDDFIYVFNMPAMNTSNKQHIFETGDAEVSLTHYSSEFPQNRNWNFIGNPYPCAFNIQNTNLDAPITVWRNNNSYAAYSPIDDAYILRPGEAFFVQAPDAMDAITFYADGRYPSTQIEIDENSYQLQLAPARERSGERTLYNFLLSDGTNTDRARLVLNEEASMEYELNRDAAKMMAMDRTVPQIWMENDGVRYAIDEQPASEAYTMGAFFGQAGEYTLNVQSGDAQGIILLTDKVENKTVDITEGAYTFSTKAGEFNGRFLIQFGHKMPTDIESIQPSAGSYQKVIVNGQLILITPEGKRYTANGVEF